MTGKAGAHIARFDVNGQISRKQVHALPGNGHTSRASTESVATKLGKKQTVSWGERRAGRNAIGKYLSEQDEFR
jgi:hypothetical protein